MYVDKRELLRWLDEEAKLHRECISEFHKGREDEDLFIAWKIRRGDFDDTDRRSRLVGLIGLWTLAGWVFGLWIGSL